MKLVEVGRESFGYSTAGIGFQGFGEFVLTIATCDEACTS